MFPRSGVGDIRLRYRHHRHLGRHCRLRRRRHLRLHQRGVAVVDDAAERGPRGVGLSTRREQCVREGA